ncbi:MAG TPA: roadblock/LC7 domain-containing protein [Trebonia sp.]|nr:roadblock/LC7 domain-containing protein [Trebonia sp.]
MVDQDSGTARPSDQRKGTAAGTPGHPAQDLNWLVTNFVERVTDAGHAVIVSSDGLPLGVSAEFPPDRAERLATLTSGLASLTQGAARALGGGLMVQTAVEMEAGVFVVMTISHGASLAVLAAPDSNLGIVAYEMSLLVERAGRMITPPNRRVSHVAVLDGDR